MALAAAQDLPQLGLADALELTDQAAKDAARAHPVDATQANAIGESLGEDASSGGTLSLQNAIKSAQQYLSGQAFSRSGLIEQLKFEGYSETDATYAVGSIRVDWNEQAAKSAKQYLSGQAFSRSGLIEQLEFEGYTRSQALNGVAAVGY